MKKSNKIKACDECEEGCDCLEDDGLDVEEGSVEDGDLDEEDMQQIFDEGICDKIGTAIETAEGLGLPFAFVVENDGEMYSTTLTIKGGRPEIFSGIRKKVLTKAPIGFSK